MKRMWQTAFRRAAIGVPTAAYRVLGLDGAHIATAEGAVLVEFVRGFTPNLGTGLAHGLPPAGIVTLAGEAARRVSQATVA